MSLISIGNFTRNIPIHFGGNFFQDDFFQHSRNLYLSGIQDIIFNRNHEFRNRWNQQFINHLNREESSIWNQDDSSFWNDDFTSWNPKWNHIINFYDNSIEKTFLGENRASTITKDGNIYKVVIDAKGIKSENISLKVLEGNQIEIQMNQINDEKENSKSSFSLKKTFKIPEIKSKEEIKATLSQEGILTVEIPVNTPKSLREVTIPLHICDKERNISIKNKIEKEEKKEIAERKIERKSFEKEENEELNEDKIEKKNKEERNFIPLSLKGNFFEDFFSRNFRKRFIEDIEEIVRKSSSSIPSICSSSNEDILKSYKDLRFKNPKEDNLASSVVHDLQSYKIIVDVEEFLEGDIQVNILKGNKLRIEGKIEEEGKKDEEKEDRKTQNRNMEFQRTFYLPLMGNFKDISAVISEDGILTIIVPKKAIEEEKRGIPIENNSKSNQFSEEKKDIKQKVTEVEKNRNNQIKSNNVNINKEEINEEIKRSEICEKNNEMKHNTTNKEVRNPEKIISIKQERNEIKKETLKEEMKIDLNGTNVQNHQMETITNERIIPINKEKEEFEINKKEMQNLNEKIIQIRKEENENERKIEENNDSNSIEINQEKSRNSSMGNFIGNSEDIVSESMAQNSSETRSKNLKSTENSTKNASSAISTENFEENSLNKEITEIIPRNSSISLNSLNSFPIMMRRNFFEDEFFLDFHSVFQNRIKEMMKISNLGNLNENRNWFDQYKNIKNILNQKENDELIKIQQNETNHQIILDLGDYKEGEINVKCLNKNEILIEGKKEEEGNQTKKSFQRCFYLSGNLQMKEMKSAISQDGILTITIPIDQQMREKDMENSVKNINEDGKQLEQIQPSSSSKSSQYLSTSSTSSSSSSKTEAFSSQNGNSSIKAFSQSIQSSS